MPARRGHRGRLLWAVDHLYWPHPIGEAFTTLAVAAVTTTRPLLGHLRPAAAPATRLRRGQAGHRSPAPLGWTLRPRSRRGHPRARVRAGRRRLPPARPAHGRGCRRAAARLGRPRRGEPPTTCRSRRRRPFPCGSGVRATPPDGGPPPSVTAGCPSSSPRTSTRTALAALRRETAEAGRDPEAVQAGVVVFACVGDDDQAPVRGAQWLSELYRLPPKAFQRHLVAGSPETCAAALDPLRGRRRPPHPRDGGGLARRRAFRPAAGCVRRRAASRRWRECRHEHTTDVAILGTGMTDMSRRDLDPDTMAYEVVHEALGDAGVSADELGLVIVGNAMAGRLSDQGCMRGPDLAAQGRPQRGRPSSTSTTRAPAGAPPSTWPRWPPPPRTARCWRSASRRCGPATGPGRSPASRTASRRSTATTCTTAATPTTIPPAASSWASTTAGPTG